MTLNNRIKIVSIFTAFFILLTCFGASAEIYKWVDEDGVLHFSDTKEWIPKKYISDAEKLKFKESDISSDDSTDTIIEPTDVSVESGLDNITIKKDEGGFNGVAFGTPLKDFLKKPRAKKYKDNGRIKTYFLGKGSGFIGSVNVRVRYDFEYDELVQVRLLFDSDKEKSFVREIKSMLGKPGLDKRPFVYWFFDNVELKVNRKKNVFYIKKKKIKKF